MKSFKFAIALLCVLALGAASGVSMSEPTELQETLSLSDEQVQQLQLIHTAAIEAVQADKRQIRTLQSQLRAELTSDAPNTAVIGQIEIDAQNLVIRLRRRGPGSETRAV